MEALRKKKLLTSINNDTLQQLQLQQAQSHSLPSTTHSILRFTMELCYSTLLYSTLLYSTLLYSTLTVIHTANLYKHRYIYIYKNNSNITICFFFWFFFLQQEKRIRNDAVPHYSFLGRFIYQARELISRYERHTDRHTIGMCHSCTQTISTLITMGGGDAFIQWKKGNYISHTHSINIAIKHLPLCSSILQY
jgi:hypothetical protein